MQVLSSLSGITFYAPSAGFAPTNSADVSAIASSYQVVSATATQLYAGTAYVTSVNDNQLSASRAGNAANAVLATSAWYDGTGRLLSSLPDEATVSAIASAYQVVSSVGTSQNGPKSIVTGINGLFISARYADTANEARKDGSGRTISSLPDSAAVSAIASSYSESAVSGKQDTLTFGYDAEDKISGINGSAIAGGGAAGVDSATCSAIASAYAESAVSAASSNYYTTANESGYALSSDVSATVDLVGTQSANWGGSALALSAGPGVKFDKVGNTLVASTDETVLWSSTATASSFTLSESISSFERLKVQGNFNAIRYWADGDASGSTLFTFANMIYAQRSTDECRLQQVGAAYTSTDGLTFTCRDGHNLYWTNTANSVGGGATAARPGLYKVIGINRTAEA